MDGVTHLLDTHAVIWAYEDPDLLGKRAQVAIARAAPRSLGISDFTLFEIAMLVAKGKLDLDLPTAHFLSCVEKDFVVVPMGSGEADLAFSLQLDQGDPFDRAIVATALCAKVPLVTKDRRITDSGLLPVVW